MATEPSQNSNSIDTIIRNVRLASFDSHLNDPYGTVSDALLAIHDNRIVYAGPEADAPAFSGANIIDGQQNWLTPGLIDCHTHLVYAGSRADEFEALRQ